jgi:hypothetical protein
MVADDLNVSEAIKEYLEGPVSSHQFIVHAIRTIEEAETWIKTASNSTQLNICILDLMFPPKTGTISGNITDLTQGLRFYEDYLKGKFRTIILTGAIRWIQAEKAIRDKIKDDENTVLLKKPQNLESIEDILVHWLS